MDKELEARNQLLQREFLANKCEINLKRYIMSEIAPPIADVYNVIELVKSNGDIIRGLELYYMAAYLTSAWLPGENEFLNKLNEKLPTVEMEDKAIIYYLNANHIRCGGVKNDSKKEYRLYLTRSVECSKNMKFANNHYDLATISHGRQAEKLYREAMENIERIETEGDLKLKDIEYWLDIQRWIKEVILGVFVTEIVYKKKYHPISRNKD